MNGKIGDFDWQDCLDCAHCDPEGGCVLMPTADSPDLDFEIDTLDDEVTCPEFEKIEEEKP